GFDDSGIQMQPPDPLIADIANQECAVAVEQNAVRLVQLGLGARPAVAAEPPGAGPGYRRDDPGFHIYFADDVVVTLRDVQVALGIEAHLMRHIQRRVFGGTAISPISLLTVPCD